jgi:ribonucleotide reductase beta subunit family protein with ferritin-like domain
MHCEFACLVFSMLQEKPKPEIVKSIISNAVECEFGFVAEALPVSLIGMNCELMKQYIMFVADKLMLALDQPKIYGVKNPFEWMDLMSLTGKTNMFERRISEYSKSGVANNNQKKDNQASREFRTDLF